VATTEKADRLTWQALPRQPVSLFGRRHVSHPPRQAWPKVIVLKKKTVLDLKLVYKKC